MTKLLEIREKIKEIYSKYEIFILPVAKLIFAFIIFSVLNDKMGYMGKINNLGLELIAALTCSFLPVSFMLVLAALFSVLHMYAMSLEVALVGVCVYMLLFIVFFRFSHKDALAVMLTVLLCSIKMPYIMPIAMGLIGTPISAVAVCCGIGIYHLLQTVVSNATTISTMESSDITGKIRFFVDNLLDNKAVVVMMAAFAITVVVVYLLRRMSWAYAWSIAMVAGAMIDLVILLVGDLMYETNMSVPMAILGSLIAIGVAKIIEFFRFCVDYTRTEKVQFEDDEYYYYVKAVPKMTVATPTKTVKKINTQREAAGDKEISGMRRSVVTERTRVSADERRTQTRSNASVRGERPQASQRIGINSNMTEEDPDIEDLF